MIHTNPASQSIAPGPVFPSPAPATIDRRALWAYATWLFYERRILCKELFPGLRHADAFVFDNRAEEFHFGGADVRPWNQRPMPSSRAELMLSTLGVDWSQHPNTMEGSGPLFAETQIPQPVEPRFPHPDAALIAANHRHAVLTDDIARDVAAGGETAALDRQIEAAERVLEGAIAKTFVGLQAKASALRRVIVASNKPVYDCPDDADDVTRMAWSLLADILSLKSPIEEAISEQAAGRS